MDAHVPRGNEMAARVRAAAAYADLNRKQLGAALGYSVETISALFAGEKSPDHQMQMRLATICNVPVSFFEVGFTPLAEMQLSTTAHQYRALQRQVTELRAAVVALAAGNLQQTREQLGLDETDPGAGHPEVGD